MIDDVVGVSESGVKAKQLNAYLNVKGAEKKLQFGHDKCDKLRIAHRNSTFGKSDELYIDHWKETHNKEGQLIETFEGKVKMANVPVQKYLGFILSEDGSNMIISYQNKRKPMAS